MITTAAERKVFFEIARSFDQMPVEQSTEEKTDNRTFAGELPPFDDYIGS